MLALEQKNTCQGLNLEFKKALLERSLRGESKIKKIKIQALTLFSTLVSGNFWLF